MNKETHAFEERRGQTRVNRSGKRIWYQLSVYAGAAYVWLEEYDVYVEVPEEDYQRIFSELNSGDDADVDAAEVDLQALANSEDMSVVR